MTTWGPSVATMKEKIESKSGCGHPSGLDHKSRFHGNNILSWELEVVKLLYYQCKEVVGYYYLQELPKKTWNIKGTKHSMPTFSFVSQKRMINCFLSLKILNIEKKNHDKSVLYSAMKRYRPSMLEEKYMILPTRVYVMSWREEVCICIMFPHSQCVRHVTTDLKWRMKTLGNIVIMCRTQLLGS